jgi:hypothetical protein
MSSHIETVIHTLNGNLVGSVPRGSCQNVIEWPKVQMGTLAIGREARRPKLIITEPPAEPSVHSILYFTNPKSMCRLSTSTRSTLTLTSSPILKVL